MKKHFLWLALGATTLAACTSTDVLEEGPQSNVIGFENVINKATRADGPISGDLTNDNFDTFVVYGYYTKDGMEATPVSVFNGEVVSKDGAGKWKYDHTRYWNPGSTYYFYAYSCADIALANDMGKPSMDLINGTDVESRSLKIGEYICNKDHQHDLICDAAEVLNKDSGTVTFSFQHALCKVSAEFVNDFPEMYDVYISDVKLVNFYDKADLKLVDNDIIWSEKPHRTESTPSIDMNIAKDSNPDRLDSSKATSTLKYGDKAERVNVDPVFMLPVKYDNGNVMFTFTLTVKVVDGPDEPFLTRNIKGTFTPTWTYGNQYKYIIHITGATAQLNEIQFDATQVVSDMTDPEGWNGEITTDMSFSM